MIRQAAVAGTFYPSDEETLRQTLRRMFPLPEGDTDRGPVKALIVPHAGYVYSGSVAGAAYARLATHAETIKRVVLLGPVHRVAVRGLALPEADRFATPLGEVDLDKPAVSQVLALPQVVVSGPAHAWEHSLEVQVPFLQSLLGEFTLVPLAVGDASAQEVAEVLEVLWGGSETLIVVSSDLSHYLPYAEARRRDRDTVDRILEGTLLASHEQACGATPINGLLLVSARHDLSPRLVSFCNSGDTGGDHDRVVGYAAIEFVEDRAARAQDQSEGERGPVLLALARSAIATALGRSLHAEHSQPWLQELGACFVTLTRKGELRGCIGSVEAHRSIMEDVIANARSAALDDPRFPPLSLDELDDTHISVSLLSPLHPLSFRSEREALEQLRPGEDGLVLEFGRRRGTFLPQVWDELPTPREFLNQLKRKAGLPADFWSDEIRLYRYSVTRWSEPEDWGNAR